MKKLILLIAILLVSVMSYGQATNARVVRIADATTAWGENLPIGTYIWDITNENLYVLTAASASTQTLTTESNKSLINASGSDDQNLTWDAVNGHIEIEDGTDADVGMFSTAGTDYGFTPGSNGAGNTAFLDGSGNWDNIDLTTDVGSSVLPISNGGTNSSTALSNDYVMVSETGAIVESTVTTTELETLSGVTSSDLLTHIVEWDEVSADDLTQPYDVTLSNTPATSSNITVQINGVPLKYAAGTDNGTFNFSGTTLSIYVNVYQYDQIEISYEY